MRLKAAVVICLLAGSVIAVAGLAQEGHPLTGVWYGDWGPNATTRNHLTIQMHWDGKNVTGIVNPGDTEARVLELCGQPGGTKEWVQTLPDDDDGGGVQVQWEEWAYQNGPDQFLNKVVFRNGVVYEIKSQ